MSKRVEPMTRQEEQRQREQHRKTKFLNERALGPLKHPLFHMSWLLVSTSESRANLRSGLSGTHSRRDSN